MPEPGDYLFSHVGFSREETPVLSFQQSETFHDLSPLSHKLTLRFDMTQRFCIGWNDIIRGKRYACPTSAKIENAYEQCAACQQRTGFNPAFYHASQISSQQEVRNLEPHILYLAYFGKDTIKVGISHAARGNARLLEQGARFAFVLDTFPSAHIARDYEAKIASMKGVAETIQLRKKITLLKQPISPTEAALALEAVRRDIEQHLSVTFNGDEVAWLDSRYFPHRPNLSMAQDCLDKHLISGKVIGMLGSLLFCEQNDSLLFIPLKKHIGFKVHVSYEQSPVTLAPRQTSLF